MKVIISTGGTGGHIFPALRVKEELERENFETFLLLGGKLKIPIEEKGVFIKAGPIMGKNILEILMNLFINIRGIIESFKILNKNKFPIIATGSYASLPVLFCAVIKNIPYFLLEQNSIPGRVNKIFSKQAISNFISFKKSLFYLKGRKIFTGNPLRKFEEVEKKKARKILGVREDEKVILVFGGSQGSVFLNNLAIELSERLREIRFILISGNNKYEEIKDKVRENILLFPFYKKMEVLYSATDIAITRAGGITLYELLYFGVPALLIPFPYATDNHQLYNALEMRRKYRFFEVFEEKDVEINRVIQVLEKLMRIKAKRMRFFAEKRIVQEIKKFIGRKKCFLN